MTTTALTLESYRLLGRSGLRVSPMCLGTMTFGADLGWGAEQDQAQRIFDTYIDRGGNFIDTANQYTNGTAENFVGLFAVGRRDRLVIATKYTLPICMRDPNAGGNHRKSMMRSVEASLRKLQTDYIDILYLHAWDATTPAEEILRGLDDLVRSGKVLYLAISDTPAWEIARLQTIADLRGWSPLIALQIEYSLVERTVERELIPMARAMGLGVIPWAPLGNGILTGKYNRSDLQPPSSAPRLTGSRKEVLVANGAVTEGKLAIADAVGEIARELGKSPAQVALAWTLHNPAVVAPTIGARTPQQLQENLGALDVAMSAEQVARLNRISAIPLGFPHDFLAQLRGHEIMNGQLEIPRR